MALNTIKQTNKHIISYMAPVVLVSCHNSQFENLHIFSWSEKTSLGICILLGSPVPLMTSSDYSRNIVRSQLD